MSLSENEIMGGIGWGNDLSFYNHSVELNRVLQAADEVDTQLDNSDNVQRYLLDRMPASNLPMSAPAVRKFEAANPLRMQVPAVGGLTNSFPKNKLEKFENAVSGTLGENTISILLTIVFMLIVAIVVLQIMHTRKVYKLVKTMMKSINELHATAK